MSDDEGAQWEVHVKLTTGAQHYVSIGSGCTVLELKQALEAKDAALPAASLRLIYKGHVLKDPQTLSAFGFESGHTIHCVSSAPRPAAAASPAAAAVGPASPSPASAFAPPPGPASPSPASAFAPPPGFGGALGGAGGGGFMAQQQQMTQQMMQNPAMMEQMMASPAMEAMLSSPAMLEGMIASNPQLSQLLESNPELGHVLRDPQLLRQTMEAARNPALRREMQRNTDLAMSNIEGHPEGFNALRRMYETVQEPMQEAVDASARATNPFSAVFGAGAPQQTPTAEPATPPTAGMSNPWAPRPPAAAADPVAAAPFGGFGGPSPFGGGGAGGMSMDQVSGMMQNPGVQQM